MTGDGVGDEEWRLSPAPGRERAQSIDWILLTGNRWLIATILVVTFFLYFRGAIALDLLAVQHDASMTRLAGGLVAGTLSLVTIVISINQLILSYEFTSTGETREQLGNIYEFRTEVAVATDLPVPPPDPADFLSILAEDVERRAAGLATATDEPAVREFAMYTRDEAGYLRETLADERFGTFSALAPTIPYDDAWQAYAARGLREHYDLSGEDRSSLTGIVDALRRFGIAREHLKTTYIQRELTRFSRLMVYSGVVAVIAAVSLALLYAGPASPTIPNDQLPMVSSTLLAVVLLPLAILASITLRMATVARRTAAIGPLVSASRGADEPFTQE